MSEQYNKLLTFTVEICMAGDVVVARQVCREVCREVGLCVTIIEADYIYSFGEERGFTIRLVNYPRFPATPDQVFAKAVRLAHQLMDRCCQRTFLLVTPHETHHYMREQT